MKNIKTFEDFINEGNINESFGSIVISSKELGTLFGDGDNTDTKTEEEIEDMLSKIGKIDSIGVNSREQVEIEFERGFITIDLKHKTIEIGK